MILKKMNNAILISLMMAFTFNTHAGLIDLSSWTATSGGSWNVDATNTSVLQTINGSPTFFLSDIDYIDTQFDGTFGVETTSDDDFIGFVFGYNNSNDYLLFDWKQTDQYWSGLGYAGFTLSRISGSDVNFWDHSGTDITVLASDYGNNGWADNVTYNFTLDFTTTRIIIDINGTNIFDVTGAFNTGKFGFYNYSQSNVRYTGFQQTTSPLVPVPEPSTLAIFALGIIGFASRKFKK